MFVVVCENQLDFVVPRGQLSFIFIRKPFNLQSIYKNILEMVQTCFCNTLAIVCLGDLSRRRTVSRDAYLPSRRREASCVVCQNGCHADRRVSTSFSFDTIQRVLRIQRVPQKGIPWMAFASEESHGFVGWAFRMDVRWCIADRLGKRCICI